MAAPTPAASTALLARLWSRKAGLMLARNTAVSTVVFLIGLLLLWAMVEYGGLPKLTAAAVGFVVANSLHYALGRSWIFRGTERPVAQGYAYFLVNGLIGLAITLLLFDALLRLTSIYYLAARVIVSLIAGFVMFLLNATLNFRRL